MLPQIAVADVVEEIAAQNEQDSDALLASTKKHKSFRNAAIAGMPGWRSSLA